MIELKNICKSYNIAKRDASMKAAVKSLFKRSYTRIQALDKISFNVGEGEIVGYIGPNGAGKSTTIKLMCGILEPDSGECVINGYTPWKKRIDYVRNIGVVFGQRSQLWWDVPVGDSFQLLKDIYKIPELNFRRNYEELIYALEIEDLVTSPARQLSLGQRMRCEIAASLLHNPSILFLDEPTIGLDAVSKMQVRKFIKKINAENKVTVILTTHDMQDIEALAGRIILIGRGKILYDGLMENIKRSFHGKKIIYVDFAQADSMKPLNITSGKILSQSGERLVLEVGESDNVADIIAEIASIREITDLNVQGAAIEEIIASFYKEMEI